MARIGIRYQLMHRNSEDFIKLQKSMPGIIKGSGVSPTELINETGLSLSSHYRKLRLCTYTIEDIVTYIEAISKIKCQDILRNEMPEIIKMARIPKPVLIEEIGISSPTFEHTITNKLFSTKDVIEYTKAIIRIKNRQITSKSKSNGNNLQQTD